MKATALRKVTNMLLWSAHNSLCQWQLTEIKKEFQPNLLLSPWGHNSSYSCTEAGHCCNTSPSSSTQHRPATLSSTHNGLHWKQLLEISQKGNYTGPLKDTTTTTTAEHTEPWAVPEMDGAAQHHKTQPDTHRVHCNVHLCTSSSHEDKENWSAFGFSMELLDCLMPVIRGQNGSGSLQATHSMRTRGFVCAACLSVTGTTSTNVWGASGKADVAIKHHHTIIKITEAAQ